MRILCNGSTRARQARNVFVSIDPRCVPKTSMAIDCVKDTVAARPGRRTPETDNELAPDSTRGSPASDLDG